MRSAALAGTGVVVTALTAFLHGESQSATAMSTLALASEAVDAPPAPEPARVIVQYRQAAPLPAPAPVSRPASTPETPSSSRVAVAVSEREAAGRVTAGRAATSERASSERAPVIALQAGHWRADEAPWELRGLRGNGTSWQGIPEWRANLDIAERAAAMLEELGYQVDVLPAVVPPRYRADLFIAIHADGSGDPNASGYRVASPRRDRTGRAGDVARLLADAYGEATGLRRIPTTTRRMRNYYAFNSRRYRHALHPSTVGVIIETGFMTSPRDRLVILDDPDRAARGIVAAVTAYPDTRLPERTGS